MTPIVTPLAASGFGPGALRFLGERLRPLGMAPMAGGAAPSGSSARRAIGRSCQARRCRSRW